MLQKSYKWKNYFYQCAFSCLSDCWTLAQTFQCITFFKKNQIDTCMERAVVTIQINKQTNSRVTQSYN